MAQLVRLWKATIDGVREVKLPSGADTLFLASLLVMSTGFWLAWQPLGLIVFGAMICLPMLIDRMRGRGGPPDA